MMLGQDGVPQAVLCLLPTRLGSALQQPWSSSDLERVQWCTQSAGSCVPLCILHTFCLEFLACRKVNEQADITQRISRQVFGSPDLCPLFSMQLEVLKFCIFLGKRVWQKYSRRYKTCTKVGSA